MPPNISPTPTPPSVSPMPPVQPRKSPSVLTTIIMIIFVGLPILLVVAIALKVTISQRSTLSHIERSAEQMRQSPHVESITYETYRNKLYSYDAKYVITGKSDITLKQATELLNYTIKLAKSLKLNDTEIVYKQLYHGKKLKLFALRLPNIQEGQHNIHSIIASLMNELDNGMVDAEMTLEGSDYKTWCTSESTVPASASEVKKIIARPLHPSCSTTRRSWKNDGHSMTLIDISDDDLSWLPFDELFSIATKPEILEVTSEYINSGGFSYGLGFASKQNKLTDIEKDIAVQFIKTIRNTKPKLSVKIGDLPFFTINQGKVSYNNKVDYRYRTADGDEVISRVNSDL